jgi:hypothetical protein
MKAFEWRQVALCICFGVGLSGCANPQLDTVFYTVTNMGVNFDSRIPAAEIALSRREGVLQPEFEGGVHLPVIATSESRPGLLEGRVTATFIGGAAAEIAARESKVTDETKLLERGPGIVCVTKLPDGTNGRLALPGPGATRPFIFGTSTNYGLFVGWDAPGTYIPETVRLGYTRRELAIASVFAAGDCPDAIKSHFATGANQAVAMPSFLATIDGGNRVGTPQTTSIAVRQSFATGSAARLLANDPKLRTALRTSISAEARQNAADADTNVSKSEKTAALEKQAAAEQQRLAAQGTTHGR